MISNFIAFKEQRIKVNNMRFVPLCILLVITGYGIWRLRAIASYYSSKWIITIEPVKNEKNSTKSGKQILAHDHYIMNEFK